METLQRYEARYEAIAEDNPDLICRFSPDGTLTFVNKAYCDYFAKKEVDLIGTSFIPLIPEPDQKRVKGHYSSLTKENPVGEVEHRVLDGQGQVRWQRWIDRALFDQDGNLCEYQSVGWEIPDPKRISSDRLEPDEELRRFLQMEAFEPVLRGMIHGIYDLFTGLLGSIGLAELEAPDNIQGYLSTAAIAVRRSERILKKIALLSGQPVSELKPLNLNSVVIETCAILSDRIHPNIEIQVDTADSVPDVMANKSRMQSILMNLCLSAQDRIRTVIENREASREETHRIALLTRVLHAGTAPLESPNSAASKQFVVISVSDNGPPMDVKAQRLIADPLSAIEDTDKKFPVLWLNIYGLVKQYDGWVQISNGAEEGTTIEIYLPAIEPEDDSNGPHYEEEESLDGTGTVLVADDEEVIRNLAKAVLTRHGYDVILARDGKEAVDKFLKNRDKTDLILLDVSMPYLTGPEVLEQIRALDPDVNVVLSSGFADNGNEEFLARIGISHFLPKPYAPRRLLQIVRRVLGPGQ